VSKTSVAGSWGAIAGNIRYFADRFGVPRASVEGTTLSYDLVRLHATLGPPAIVLTGPRKHQQLAVSRRLAYFGFELETDIEPLTGRIPAELLSLARAALATALLDGQTPHPDQGSIRRAASQLREWWRRSGGTLALAAEPELHARIETQLEGVRSWKDFLATPLQLEPEVIVSESERRRLEALPGIVRLHGDAVPLDYEVDGGQASVRLRLREGQARRLAAHELPVLDRPLRFEGARGAEPPLRAETLEELKHLLRHPVKRVAAHRQRGRPPRRGGRRR
jgi:hypothetical protein